MKFAYQVRILEWSPEFDILLLKMALVMTELDDANDVKTSTTSPTPQLKKKSDFSFRWK